MLFLTDGYKGEAHVRADHIGYYNLGMVGYDNGYFPSDYVGSFETEILSSNKVRIKQGVGLIGGRRFAIDSYEDVTIENGATGEKRIDVIYFGIGPEEPESVYDGVSDVGVPFTTSNAMLSFPSSACV